MPKPNVLFLFYFIVWIALASCQQQSKNIAKQHLPKINAKTIFQATNYQKIPMDSLTTMQIAGHWVDILSPQDQEIIGCILVLPGWNFPKEDWCKNSSLCQKALQKGYILIMPEMGKSVYSAQFYPETRQDWLQFPNKNWILNDLIPTLQQKYNLLTNNQKNFLIGLSTGGRGVALIALAHPDIFTAAAALSGDYEQTQMPEDNLMRGYYGELNQFPQRWKGEDNPALQAHLFKTPIYLGHGTEDDVVPYQQTIIFYEALKQANPSLKVVLNTPKAKHDYAYWDSEVENMLAFFEQF